MCKCNNLLFANVKSVCEKITRGPYTGQLEAAFHAVKYGSLYKMSVEHSAFQNVHFDCC